jgi:hypothetical protein
MHGALSRQVSQAYAATTAAPPISATCQKASARSGRCWRKQVQHSGVNHLGQRWGECITGWYDLFLREALADYAALRDTGRNPALIVGL